MCSIDLLHGYLIFLLLSQFLEYARCNGEDLVELSCIKTRVNWERFENVDHCLHICGLKGLKCNLGGDDKIPETPNDPWIISKQCFRTFQAVGQNLCSFYYNERTRPKCVTSHGILTVKGGQSVIVKFPSAMTKPTVFVYVSASPEGNIGEAVVKSVSADKFVFHLKAAESNHNDQFVVSWFALDSCSGYQSIHMHSEVVEILQYETIHDINAPNGLFSPDLYLFVQSYSENFSVTAKIIQNKINRVVQPKENGKILYVYETPKIQFTVNEGKERTGKVAIFLIDGAYYKVGRKYNLFGLKFYLEKPRIANGKSDTYFKDSIMPTILFAPNHKLSLDKMGYSSKWSYVDDQWLFTCKWKNLKTGTAIDYNIASGIFFIIDSDSVPESVQDHLFYKHDDVICNYARSINAFNYTEELSYELFAKVAPTLDSNFHNMAKTHKLNMKCINKCNDMLQECDSDITCLQNMLWPTCNLLWHYPASAPKISPKIEAKKIQIKSDDILKHFETKICGSGNSYAGKKEFESPRYAGHPWLQDAIKICNLMFKKVRTKPFLILINGYFAKDFCDYVTSKRGDVQWIPSGVLNEQFSQDESHHEVSNMFNLGALCMVNGSLELKTLIEDIKNVYEDEYNFIDCIEGEWNEWGPCQSYCIPDDGTVVRTRTRDILYESRENGRSCLTTQSELCKDLPSCSEYCLISPWSEWSECIESKRTRERYVQINTKGCSNMELEEEEDCDPGDTSSELSYQRDSYLEISTDILNPHDTLNIPTDSSLEGAGASEEETEEVQQGTTTHEEKDQLGDDTEKVGQLLKEETGSVEDQSSDGEIGGVYVDDQESSDVISVNSGEDVEDDNTVLDELEGSQEGITYQLYDDDDYQQYFNTSPLQYTGSVTIEITSEPERPDLDIARELDCDSVVPAYYSKENEIFCKTECKRLVEHCTDRDQLRYMALLNIESSNGHLFLVRCKFDDKTNGEIIRMTRAFQNRYFISGALYSEDNDSWIDEQNSSCICSMYNAEPCTEDDVYLLKERLYNLLDVGFCPNINDPLLHFNHTNPLSLSYISLANNKRLHCPIANDDYNHMHYHITNFDSKQQLQQYCQSGSIYAQSANNKTGDYEWVYDCSTARSYDYSIMTKDCMSSCNTIVSECNAYRKKIIACMKSYLITPDVTAFKKYKCPFPENSYQTDICLSIFTEDVHYRDECLTLCRMANEHCEVTLSLSQDVTREKCIMAAFDESYYESHPQYVPKKLLPEIQKFREGCRLSKTQHMGKGYVLCKFKPQDCLYTEWSEWSACTGVCNDFDHIHTRHRTRSLLETSKNGVCTRSDPGTVDMEICIDLPPCSKERWISDNKRVVEIVEPLSRNVKREEMSIPEWIKYAYRQYPELVEVINEQNRCEILKSVKGSTLQQSSCSCPKNYTPCTFSMAIVDKTWVKNIDDFCRQNPYAYIVFEKIRRYIYYCNIGMLILQEANKESECNYIDSNEYICCQPNKIKAFKFKVKHFIILGVITGLAVVSYLLLKNIILRAKTRKIWKYKE